MVTTEQAQFRSALARAIAKHGAQRVFDMLDADQRAALPYMWRLLARPQQLAPPRKWRWWLIQSGRGFGKTRSGAEWYREKARRMPGGLGALVGQTPDEVRKVMIEGPAGILASCPANERPTWEPSIGVLRFPNGFTAQVFSGAKPDGLRGSQFHIAWIDELAKMAKSRAVYDEVNMTLRLDYLGGAPEDVEPQALVTTTPRPIEIMRELAKRAAKGDNVVITRGSTRENFANLAKSTIEELTAQYEGTRLGRQELEGILLDDTPGALWQRAWFERVGFRTSFMDRLEEFERIAVAFDPAASDNESSAESGIVVVGSFAQGPRTHLHVLADRSLYGTPGERCRAVLKALIEFEADTVVVETNNGGDWLPAALANEWRAMRDEGIEGVRGACPVQTVTATRGKHTRAEPISTLYEQVGTVTHEPGLVELEDQLCTWSPLLLERSPDRLDALVWAGTYLTTTRRAVLT